MVFEEFEHLKPVLYMIKFWLLATSNQTLLCFMCSFILSIKFFNSDYTQNDLLSPTCWHKMS